MILDSKNLIYKAVYHGARSFAEVFSTLEVEGWENVPAGACLFASNHQSMLDPPWSARAYHARSRSSLGGRSSITRSSAS